MSAASELELKTLKDLTRHVGSDPLLTQASTGNSSAKLNDILWIKASGKWMAAAARNEIFVPLSLTEVTECLRRGLDPADWFPGASLETAMHAVVPHRIVLHVHSVDAIAWAVRKDAVAQLQARLEGLRWQWIPYMPSGLPLCRAMERALSTRPNTDVFILGNHGLVVGGDDTDQVGYLLNDVRRRLSIPPRRPHPADYAVISEICAETHWDIPDDDEMHALSTDAVSQSILAGGVLYPCQAIFSGVGTTPLFQPIRYCDQRDTQYSNRPFLLVGKYGVIVNRSIRPAELAMLSGLAQVVQRLSASAPIRYLTDDEIAGLSCQVAYRYRDLANANQANITFAGP